MFGGVKKTKQGFIWPPFMPIGDDMAIPFGA